MNLQNSKKYKAIISDFDGTLAGSDFQIPLKVKAAIKRWVDSQSIFSIASGRAFPGILQQTCRLLALTNPIITRGGAEIVDPQSGKTLHIEYMPDSDVRELIKLFLEEGIMFAVEKKDVAYTPDAFLFKGYGPYIFKDIKDLVVADIPKIHVSAIKDIAKQKIVEEMLSTKSKRLSFIDSSSPAGKGWDITSIKATKHMGVLLLMKMLGLKEEEVIGIGDGYNDYPLLTACGYKIAMENANEALKAIADYIAPSYKEEGVAVVINLLLENKRVK